VSFNEFTWSIIRAACLPGAMMLSFGGSRTFHRIAVAIEDAGWELRDTICWVYGSGFPKSLDISKAIDKANGAARKLSPNPLAAKQTGQKSTVALAGDRQDNLFVSKPLSLGGILWDGYGTALKPAYEPIILSMNPVVKTFANNALTHGVAGLNIDGCRVPLGEESAPTGSAKRVFASNQFTEDKVYGDNTTTSPKGRFPANFIHDGSEEVVGLFPQSKGQQGDVRGTEKSHTGDENTNCYGEYGRVPAAKRSDSGSAARFFYCAKAARSERDAGLEGMSVSDKHTTYGDYKGTPEHSPNIESKSKNSHPTVKPLALMTYLCKLVKMPTYNLILDPFCGSGTTLLACGSLGIRSIGIDSDEKSCEIAAARCSAQAIEMIKKGEY
jgi:site-specific DNA-methyltransferase (adenine-specific)